MVYDQLESGKIALNSKTDVFTGLEPREAFEFKTPDAVHRVDVYRDGPILGVFYSRDGTIFAAQMIGEGGNAMWRFMDKPAFHCFIDAVPVGHWREHAP